MQCDMKTEQKQDAVIAYLYGEIDHHTAQFLRKRLDGELLYTDSKCLILDFSQISFMDSSGIGLILGRKQLLDSVGGKLQVRHAPPALQRILKLAGISCMEGEYAK